MFDTNLAVVGNVLTAPEWRRLGTSGSLVANFRVASTARRFDRDKGQWVDGNNFRVRVTAWRRLAEGVASSIAVGDPVVVYGRLFSRDWTDDEGNPRMAYEMEAFSIGHDLARGRAKFFRTRMAQVTSELESAEAATRVRGETSVPLSADEAPVTYGDGLPDQLSEHEPTFVDVAPGAASSSASITARASAPASASASASASANKASSAERAADKPAAVRVSTEEAAPAEESGTKESGTKESTPREDVETEPSEERQPTEETGLGEETPSESDDLTLEVERLVAEQKPPTSTRRPRRTSKREPIAV